MTDAKAPPMTKREARQWVRDHWIKRIRADDCPDQCPFEAAMVWGDESNRIADRIERSTRK